MYPAFEKIETIIIMTNCGAVRKIKADKALNNSEGLITFYLNRRKIAQAGVANLLFWCVVDDEAIMTDDLEIINGFERMIRKDDRYWGWFSEEFTEDDLLDFFQRVRKLINAKQIEESEKDD